jgi:hypothetical protein
MGLFDMIDSFLNPQEGYDKAKNQLDKYYKEGQGYLAPYSEYGKTAYGDLTGAMHRLLNPEALQNQWIKSYTESPAAKNAEGIARQEGLDAASSMGLLGSNTALNALQGGTSKIAMADRQNYLDNLMQKYLAGTGIAGNIFNTGAGAAGTLSGNAMTMAPNFAEMAFGKENAPGDLFGKLLGTGIGLYTGKYGQPANSAGNAGSSAASWFLGG